MSTILFLVENNKEWIARLLSQVAIIKLWFIQLYLLSISYNNNM